MIHGVCCGAAGIKAAADAGLTYIEPALNQMRSLDDEKLDTIRREAEAAGVPAAGFNCFFGGEIMLYKTDRDEILGYAEHNFKVAQRLGGSYCVIGSGRSRAVPDDMDLAAAEDAFCSIVSAMGRIAAKYGLELVPAGDGDGDISRILDGIDADITLTVEPHLAVFSGYSDIDRHEMKNKYMFKSQDEAFDTAVGALKRLLYKCGFRIGGKNEWKRA